MHEVDTAAETPQARAPRAPAPAPAPRWWSWTVLRWAAAPIALAALATALVAADRGPRWEVLAASGTGVAIVNDRPIPMNHIDDLKRWIRPGVRVRVPDDSYLEIAGFGQIAFHLEPGADFTLPRPPGRWFARTASGTIRSGAVHVTSGRRFAGARLTLVTPEAAIEMTGTSFAVMRETQGTTVSVLEGTVRMGALNGPMSAVPQDERRTLFSDGRAPESAALPAVEAEDIEQFRLKCRGILSR
jgi:hypothetical protein